MNSNEEYDYAIKILLKGAWWVGKSSIFRLYTSGECVTDRFRAIIYPNVMIVYRTLNNIVYRLQIFDCEGPDDFGIGGDRLRVSGPA